MLMQAIENLFKHCHHGQACMHPHSQGPGSLETESIENMMKLCKRDVGHNSEQVLFGSFSFRQQVILASALSIPDPCPAAATLIPALQFIELLLDCAVELSAKAPIYALLIGKLAASPS